MRKGEATKKTILDHALGLAGAVGLDGLSIGRLAEELKLSKSGLFAHFRSKEALQIQVLRTASERFTAGVIKPALKAPRGAPRLIALFDLWLTWSKGLDQSGRGCVFFAAATELDDQPGALRDELVGIQRGLAELIAGIFRQAQRDGLLRADLRSPEDLAQEVYGLSLGFHFFHRLLKDPRAEARARASLQSLLDGMKP